MSDPKPITVSKVHESDLDDFTERKIAGLIARTYLRQDYAGRSYFQQRHHFRLMACQDQELVAHMAVVFRTVRLGERLLDIMGIAEVATDVRWRRLGLATRLLNEAIEEGQRSSAQFLLLFGTENLYARAGFAKATNPITLVDLADCRTRQTVELTRHALMVKPVGDTSWDAEARLDLLGHIF